MGQRPKCKAELRETGNCYEFAAKHETDKSGRGLT
jgi:hypothetical protein